jgi:hypothetical protein
MFVFMFSLPAFATVVVTSPANGSTVSPAVPVIATANTSTCSKGIASVGVYVDNNLLYVTSGTSLNATLTLPTGKHNVVVQAWDYCNGTTATPIALNVSEQAEVAVSSPANNSTVSSPVSFAASATTGCAQGVSASGIYVDNNLAFKEAGANLNTQLAMAPGQHAVVVQAWDNCGGVSKTPLDLKVGGTTVYNLQSNGNWNQWGELAPVYDICTECSGVTWSMVPNQKNISLSGSSTQFNVGGSIPYSDVLWSNPVLGQGNTRGLTDANHALLPTLHNFTLNADVYVTNLAVTQDLELDINMYIDGIGMEWGTQCDHLADGDWDLWDNANASWFSSGIPCNLNDRAWNHVAIQVQRESDNSLLYQSITVNGVTSTINRTVPPFSVPSGWWGMTVNYQMDGNYRMASNTTYVDNMNFTYW